MSKHLVIYCYYEKSNEYQENLKFFLKHGINDEMDYVFIINGNVCNVQIPSLKNIKILSRHNDNFDFGAYAYAIKNTENIYTYEYIFFINTSVRGPFLPSYCKNKWFEPFINLFKDDIKLVGTTINILNCVSRESEKFRLLTNYEKPYTHVQSQMFVLNKESLQFLINKNFFNFSVKNDNFVDFIANTEILMSQLILKNNWNISCILSDYQNIDYRKIKKDINFTSKQGDPNFVNSCFGRSLHPYDVIFIKTNRQIMNNEINSLTLTFNKKLDIIIYILYHDDESYLIAKKLEKYSWAKLIKIESNYLFENIIFKYLNEHQDEWFNKAFVGILTYNAINKIKIYDINNLAQLYYNFDIISFNNYYYTSLINQATVHHPEFKNIWIKIFNKLNIPENISTSSNIPCFFNNYWMAKPDFMSKYINFFNTILNIINNDNQIKELIDLDSKYNGTLSQEKLIKIFGKPYYTYHPFIFERLICLYTFITNSKLYQPNNDDIIIPEFNSPSKPIFL